MQASPSVPVSRTTCFLHLLYDRNMLVMDRLLHLPDVSAFLLSCRGDQVAYLNAHVEAVMPASVPRPLPAHLLVQPRLPSGHCARYHDEDLLDWHVREVAAEQRRQCRAALDRDAARDC